VNHTKTAVQGGDAQNEYRPFPFSCAERGYWLKTAHPCVSKETKPAKLYSLIEKKIARVFKKN
jgi:hypothetical protein